MVKILTFHFLLGFSTKPPETPLDPPQIEDIRHWMVSDRLLLNDDKTEFLLIGTRQQLNKVDSLPLKLEQWI